MSITTSNAQVDPSEPHEATPSARDWAELSNRVALQEVDVSLPGSGVAYTIWKPDDMDRLLDAVQNDPEQNLPYWAEVWPSGVALAAEIVAEPGVLAGSRVFEIGSGIGITAIAALATGADLTVADYADDALTLCSENTRRNAGRQPVAIQCNWREPGSALGGLAPFPVVLAADVLYESRDVEPLLSLLDTLVAADGLLWLAEPGRAAAKRFLALLLERSWVDQSTTHDGPWLDPEDAGTIVTVHQLRRDAGVSDSNPSS
ncbi:MAG: methyltransferase domain-containing protein [Thermomicrobiales bacterium]|nr:methyltransferase domain-containing protein [Thermomicrobiales bacterium]